MKEIKTKQVITLAVAYILQTTTAHAELPQLEAGKRFNQQPGIGTQIDGSRFRPQIQNPCPDGWRAQSRSGSDFTCAPIKPRISCPEGTSYFENGCNFGCSSLI
jgi:hypothetical protein